MRLLNWFRPPSAPLPDLEEQLNFAQKARHDAEEDLNRAIAAFDADPSAKTERAVTEARQAVASYREHVARSERALAPARAKAAEAERQQLEVDRIDLERQIDDLEGEAKKLVLNERDAWLRIIEAREVRDKYEMRIRKLLTEYQGVRARLGEHVSQHDRYSMTWRHSPHGAQVAIAIRDTLTRGKSDKFIGETTQRLLVGQLAIAADKT